MPQTKRAARTLRASMAFRMRELASCHFIVDCRLSVGSSIVTATCGRSAFFDACAGSFSERSARKKGGAQAMAVPILMAEERNLRRFIVELTYRKECSQSRARCRKEEEAEDWMCSTGSSVTE